MARRNTTAGSGAGEVGWRQRLRRADYRVWIAVCLLFAARALCDIPLNLPFILPDEVGYLANARHMAGRGNIAMLDASFYNAGYSLLLLPSQLFGSPELDYRLALLTNCLLAALLFAALYAVARSVTGVSPNEAMAISAAACLYPANWFWASSAMSETTCAIVLPAAIVTLVRWLERPTLGRGAGFCGAMAFGFAVHGRFAALPLLAVLVLFGLRGLRRISWAQTLFLLATLASMIGLIAMLNAHLMAAMWDAGAPTSRLMTKVALGEILKPGGLQRLLNFTMGQVSYMALATYGLAPIAVVLLAMQVRWPQGRFGGRAESRIVTLFVLTGALSVAIAATMSLLFSFQGPHLGTYDLLYGRYEDAAAPLLIAIGLAAYAPSIRKAIAVTKAARLRTLCAAAGMLVPAIVLLAFEPGVNSGLGFHQTVSINHLEVPRIPFHFGLAVMMAGAAFLGLDALWRLRLGLGLAMLAALFLVPSAINYRNRLLAQKFDSADAAGIVEPLRSQDWPKRMAVDETLVPEGAAGARPLVFSLQYLLPDTVAVRFDPAKQPQESLVLAPLSWGPAVDPDARIAGSSAWNANERYPVLWVRSGDPSYAAYRERIFPDLPMFGSYMRGNTGHISGLSRVATPADPANFLVLGQNTPLPAGSYSLEARYSLSGLQPGQSGADWDVMLDQTILAAGQLAENGQDRILRCKFGVTPEMSGRHWEFRMLHKGVATVRFDSAILRRAGT